MFPLLPSPYLTFVFLYFLTRDSFTYLLFPFLFLISFLCQFPFFPYLCSFTLYVLLPFSPSPFFTRIFLYSSTFIPLFSTCYFPFFPIFIPFMFNYLFFPKSSFLVSLLLFPFFHLHSSFSSPFSYLFIPFLSLVTSFSSIAIPFLFSSLVS